MKKFLIVLALTLFASSTYAADNTVGFISTTFRLVGKNDGINIERFDDPKVENVSCYTSRAVVGGMFSAFTEDPSRFSVACRATGSVKIIGDIDKTASGEKVFSEKTSILFKSLTLWRHYDASKKVLTYTLVSTKLVDGSPFNSITAVPVQ